MREEKLNARGAHFIPLGSPPIPLLMFGRRAQSLNNPKEAVTCLGGYSVGKMDSRSLTPAIVKPIQSRNGM
jgi:hypothetical protein